MITQNTPQQKQSWQSQLSEAITDPKELLTELELPTTLFKAANLATQLFQLRVPRSFLERMKKGDVSDPLLLQVLPQIHETYIADGYNSDPLVESQVIPTPGLIHKYHGRVLLTVTGACAVNCRYCFRRHFPYGDNQINQLNLEKLITYIQSHKDIDEVILSGGDPLLANDKYLEKIIKQIAEISHVNTLRIHTRLPIVLPARITKSLIKTLTHSRLKIVMVIHCNHPQEIDAEVSSALSQLRQADMLVLNQSVLLKGINDCSEVMVKLSKKLFQSGTLPYYLHLLDKVQGAAHFDVSAKIGKMIIQQMMEQLPGYLVPKLVREVPGEQSKSLIW